MNQIVKGGKLPPLVTRKRFSPGEDEKILLTVAKYENKPYNELYGALKDLARKIGRTNEMACVARYKKLFEEQKLATPEQREVIVGRVRYKNPATFRNKKNATTKELLSTEFDAQSGAYEKDTPSIREQSDTIQVMITASREEVAELLFFMKSRTSVTVTCS